MKQWNWKRMIQVVLILLLLVSISTQLYRCATTETFESLYHNGRPHLKIVCSNIQYPMDHVEVDLSIGILETLDAHSTEFYTPYGHDSFSHFALYFCAWEHYEMDLNSLDISDYTNLEKHHFIKEISAQDAFSSAYEYFEIFGGIVFKHTESLVIPREVLEEYKRDGVIALKIVGYTQTGGKLTVGHTSFIRIPYKILDGEYVQFTF